MTENRDMVKVLLTHASILLSEYCTSLGGHGSEVPIQIQRAIKASRALCRAAIQVTISEVGGAFGGNDRDAAVTSFHTVSFQISAYKRLLQASMPQEYAKKETVLEARHLAVAISGVPGPIGRKSDLLIKAVDNRLPRTELTCVRALAAEAVITEAAKTAGVDIGSSGFWEIRRAITFPPEFKQAGISILSYFGHVIAQKYPDVAVAVTIEQRKDKVIMLIETPEGQRETIERELRDYGLVVTGEMAAEEYLRNPKDVLALKHKLEMAALELRHTKELLYSERKQYDARILALEEQTKLLRDVLDRDKYETAKIIERMEHLASQANTRAREAVQAIITILEKSPAEEDKDTVVRELKIIAHEDKSLFSYLQELIIKGSISGAAGNFLYACLLKLSSLF